MSNRWVSPAARSTRAAARLTPLSCTVVPWCVATVLAVITGPSITWADIVAHPDPEERPKHQAAKRRSCYGSPTCQLSQWVGACYLVVWTMVPFARYRVVGIPASSANRAVWLAPYEPSLINAMQTSAPRRTISALRRNPAWRP
jgi:hypothetical protein